jgi:tRNA(fMet)-specific endonuclease VapC
LTYSLDTNISIELIRNRLTGVRERFEAVVNAGNEITISSIVLYELWFGASKSKLPRVNQSLLESLLLGVTVLPFDHEDARTAGEIRAKLEANGRGIGPYDTLIAGQALRRKLVLVTANVGEFSRVKGLRVENWSVQK